MEWIVSLTPEAGDPWKALAAPPPGAGIVELRADLFPGIDLAAVISGCPLPVLVTLRSAAEGGRGPDDPRSRESFLRAALEAGAVLLDLELDRDLPAYHRLGLEPERVVLSAHLPRAEELEPAVDRLLASPARWLKAVAPVSRLAELGQVIAVQRRHSRGRSGHRRLIAFGMGPVGLPSRYLGPLLGAPIGFAAWSRASAAAPGQQPAAIMEAALGHLEGPPQRLFGVVGGDVSASLSPAMHGAGYRAAALPYLMIPVSVSDPAELDLLFRPAGQTLFDGIGLPVGGWAVTAPYKDAAARAATVTAPRVRSSGAANTLVLRPTQVFADTTDADGVVAALRSAEIVVAGRAALVQGTGGAARAAAVGLHLAGARVLLRGRDPALTARTAERIGVEAAPTGGAATSDLLVNATPLGADPADPLPFAEPELAHAAAVVELVYGDAPTPLEMEASRLGLAVVDGREVLLHQGFSQFAAFTGVLPPKDEMRQAVRQEHARARG